jgi:hypothetical protein
MRFIQTLQLLLVFVLTQQTASVITTPVTGQTVSGQVSISGTADAPNFASAELAFAYASDATGTWFTLQTFAQPVQNSTLATWDTSLLTDGDYTLRLRVILQDGTSQDVTVTDLHVRNAVVPPTAAVTPTQLPTATATASPLPINETFATPSILSTPLPTETPIAVSTSAPQPTPLPANPAALTTDSIYFYLIRGALLALILFIVLGIFLRFRSR